MKSCSNRIVKRLDGIKGPAHKGDYSKMEAESVSHYYNIIILFYLKNQNLLICMPVHTFSNN